MDHHPSRPHLPWFQLTGKIHVACVDRVDTANVHPDRITPFWALVLISGGDRSFRVYEENFYLHRNDFFLLPPHVQHQGIQNDQHQAYYAHFFAEGHEVNAPKRIDPGSILLPLCGQIPANLPCFDLMHYAFRHRMPPFCSDIFLSSQVQAVLHQLSLSMQKNALWPRQERDLSAQILKYIDDSKACPFRLEDYEAAFGKTYRRLNTIFQHVYGITIKQMQIRLRIEQAKRMLSFGHSITETGAECGFEDYFYFLKVFKSQTGMTPSEFFRSLD